MSANHKSNYVTQDDVKNGTDTIIKFVRNHYWTKGEDSMEVRQKVREIIDLDLLKLEKELKDTELLLNVARVERLMSSKKCGGNKFKWEKCNAHIAICEHFRTINDPIKPVESEKTTETKPAFKSAKSKCQATAKKSTAKKSTETKEKPEHK